MALPAGPDARAGQERFLAVAAPLLREGLTLRFRVTGSSMLPFVRSGDDVELEPAAETPELGEIAMAHVEGHGIVIHRVVARDTIAQRVTLGGDGLHGHDLTIPGTCVLGVVTAVRTGDGPWRGTRPLAARVWRMTRVFRHGWRRMVSRWSC